MSRGELGGALSMAAETNRAMVPGLFAGDKEEGAPKLRCYKLSKDARWPEYGTREAAGLDLFSARTILIPSSERRLISTDIACEIPAGCYIRVAPRSSLALRENVDVVAGVIDRDYRGAIQVLLHNAGQRSYLVRVGDRIAQAITEKILRPTVVPAVRLTNSARGASGFGSTGR